MILTSYRKLKMVIVEVTSLHREGAGEQRKSYAWQQSIIVPFLIYAFKIWSNGFGMEEKAEQWMLVCFGAGCIKTVGGQFIIKELLCIVFLGPSGMHRGQGQVCSNWRIWGSNLATLPVSQLKKIYNNTYRRDL